MRPSGTGASGIAELPDRRVDLHLVIDGLEEILGWVLGLRRPGGGARPPALRLRVETVAARVARIHVPLSLTSCETERA